MYFMSMKPPLMLMSSLELSSPSFHDGMVTGDEKGGGVLEQREESELGREREECEGVRVSLPGHNGRHGMCRL